MTAPGAVRIAKAALTDQRGTAFLMSLMIVMVMTLLGVALFEMSTIESGLARSDVQDIQAFYCAEAEAARVYGLYANDPNAELPSPRFRATFLLANVQYDTLSGAEGQPLDITVTATCTLLNGRSRTVQRKAMREAPSPIINVAMAGAGADPATGSQSAYGDMVLDGADAIIGNIYVSGNVHLRGSATVGATPADPPVITVAAGKAVTSTSSAFTAAPGTWAQGQITPLPVLSNTQGVCPPSPPAPPCGIIDQIRSAVTGPDGKTQLMTGRFQDATVYNLGAIFAQLGATNEGNRERNLAKPNGCTFGVASSDVKCQIWQDLAILGPRELCGPSSPCPQDLAGPTDRPSYYFMGLPRSSSVAPQGTPFSTIYAAAVSGSPELQQLGFTPLYSSLGSRLDTILGGSPTSEGRIDRLVDLTVGINPATGTGMERPPAIFYVDGYWRTDDSASGFAYNGRGTIVSSKSAIFADSVLYLGSPANVNVDLPPAGCPPGSDLRLCGKADMLGVIAQENIWVGDSNGQVHEVDAVMLAGRDINLVAYAASAATCCDGLSYPLTFNGAVLGLRGIALARDWADPTRPETVCSSAQPPCRPITFVRGDTSCGPGAEGCWRFLSKDPVTGLFNVDPAPSSFQACVSGPNQPLAPLNCRRVTHFQLTINYDKRLLEHPELAPPGLPAKNLIAVRWKDCGSNPNCQ